MVSTHNGNDKESEKNKEEMKEQEGSLVHTSVICSERQPVQFQRHAPAEIDLNPLGNRYNRAQYKLVHRVNMHPTMEPHSHPLSDPGVLLWHEILFSYSPKRRAVMLQPLPDYSCKPECVWVDQIEKERNEKRKHNAQMKITIVNWEIKESLLFYGFFFVFHTTDIHIHKRGTNERSL